jgi:hypothetical protein
VAENSALQGWQPIEAAPRDGIDILLAVFSDEYHGGAWICSGQWGTSTILGQTGNWWADNAAVGCRLPFDPTHWMPLPAAPAPIAMEAGE